MPALNIKNIFEWPLGTRILVLALIFAGAFYVGYYFDLSALRQSLHEGTQKELELKEQYQATVRKAAKLQTMMLEYQQYTATLKDWEKKFVRHINLPELLNDILKFAATNQLYVTLFNPGDAIIEEPYAKIPIHLMVVGGYHQIAQFMSEIANMSWIVVIGNFTLTNEAKNDALGAKLAEVAAARNLLLADLTLEIYYPPPPGSIPPPKKEEKAEPTPTATPVQGTGHGH